MDEILPVGDVQVEDKRAVLIENGAMRGLENDVFRRIPRCQLLLRFGGEFIKQVLRFPVAKDESEVGDDFAIDADVVAVGCGARLFADEGEAAECCVVLQQILEGDADGSFVLCAEVGILAEFGVVGCYRFVRGFDVKHAFSSKTWG